MSLSLFPHVLIYLKLKGGSNNPIRVGGGIFISSSGGGGFGNVISGGGVNLGRTGCPIFGTTYGSLQELIIPEVGALSNSATELSRHLKEADGYNRKECYEYVCDNFLAKHMAENYVRLYEKVIRGESLNTNNPYSISFSDPLLPWGE